MMRLEDFSDYFILFIISVFTLLFLTVKHSIRKQRKTAMSDCREELENTVNNMESFDRGDASGEIGAVQRVVNAFNAVSTSVYTGPILIGQFTDLEIKEINESEVIRKRLMKYESRTKQLFINELGGPPHEMVAFAIERELYPEISSKIGGEGTIKNTGCHEYSLNRSDHSWKPVADASFGRFFGRGDPRRSENLLMVEVADTQCQEDAEEKVFEIVMDNQACRLGIVMKILRGRTLEETRLRVRHSSFINVFRSL